MIFINAIRLSKITLEKMKDRIYQIFFSQQLYCYYGQCTIFSICIQLSDQYNNLFKLLTNPPTYAVSNQGGPNIFSKNLNNLLPINSNTNQMQAPNIFPSNMSNQTSNRTSLNPNNPQQAYTPQLFPSSTMKATNAPFLNKAPFPIKTQAPNILKENYKIITNSFNVNSLPTSLNPKVQHNNDPSKTCNRIKCISAINQNLNQNQSKETLRIQYYNLKYENVNAYNTPSQSFSSVNNALASNNTMGVNSFGANNTTTGFSNQRSFFPNTQPSQQPFMANNNQQNNNNTQGQAFGINPLPNNAPNIFGNNQSQNPLNTTNSFLNKSTLFGNSSNQPNNANLFNQTAHLQNNTNGLFNSPKSLTNNNQNIFNKNPILANNQNQSNIFNNNRTISLNNSNILNPLPTFNPNSTQPSMFSNSNTSPFSIPSPLTYSQSVPSLQDYTKISTYNQFCNSVFSGLNDNKPGYETLFYMLEKMNNPHQSSFTSKTFNYNLILDLREKYRYMMILRTLIKDKEEFARNPYRSYVFENYQKDFSFDDYYDEKIIEELDQILGSRADVHRIMQNNPTLVQRIVEKRNDIEIYLIKKIEKYEDQRYQTNFRSRSEEQLSRKRSLSEYNFHASRQGDIVHPKWTKEMEQEEMPNFRNEIRKKERALDNRSFDCDWSKDENYEIEEMEPNMRKYKGKDGRFHPLPFYYK